MTAVDTRERPTARGRVVGARALAVVGLLVWWVLLMGTIDLSVPIYQPPSFYDAYVIETGWGLLYTVLLGLPAIALIVRPRSQHPARQTLLVAGALVVVAIVTPELGHAVPAALAVGLVLAVRRLAGAPAWPTPVLPLRPRSRADATSPVEPRSRADAASAALLVVGAPPALAYSIDMVLAAREARHPVDITQGLDHWPAQGAFTLALIGAAALAVLTGSRVVTASVVVSALWFGVICVLYPDHSASVGSLGGWATIGWGVAFLVATEAARRRDHGAGPGGGVSGAVAGGSGGGSPTGSRRWRAR